MTKKHINKKGIRQFVTAELLKGRSKNDIRDELVEQYFDAEQITKHIAGTPNPEDKKKVKSLNVLFGVLTIVLVIYRFLLFGIDYIGSGLTLITMFYAFLVFRYDAMAYRTIAALTAVSFLRFFMNSQFETSYAILIDLALSLIILRLGFHIGDKLFPHFGLLGPNKDADRRVILEKLPTT